jgi:AAA family ATP:ADP antiporter
VSSRWLNCGRSPTRSLVRTEGKRLFGFIAAGGTVGGVAAGFGAKWTLHLSVESNHLLWVVGGIYLTASLLLLMTQRRLSETSPEKAVVCLNEIEPRTAENVFARLADPRYLKTIAAVILVLVMVSTHIDFQLKAAAQAIYPSKSALAGFFSSYYGWLSVATFFAQVVLTRKTLSTLGLYPSVYLTPVVLLTGTWAIMIWSGLVAAALTRIADATLRNSIHRSSMEIVHMAVPAVVRKSIKTFLDVVVERVGDASAGFMILLFSLSSMGGYKIYVHSICVVLIIVWIVLIQVLRSGYSEALRQGMLAQELSLPCVPEATARAKVSSGD